MLVGFVCFCNHSGGGSVTDKVISYNFSIFYRGFHSRITGPHGKGEGISLTPHYHFHPLHRHLGISRTITAENSPLHIASSRTRTGKLLFPSALNIWSHRIMWNEELYLLYETLKLHWYLFKSLRSSHQRCPMKKSVLRNLAKFTGKHLCQSLFFKVASGMQLY